MEGLPPQTLPALSSAHSSREQISFQAVLEDRAEQERKLVETNKKLEGFGESHVWESERNPWP